MKFFTKITDQNKKQSKKGQCQWQEKKREKGEKK